MKQFPPPLPRRQQFLLEAIGSLGKATNRELLDRVNRQFEPTSRVTVARDLKQLHRKRLIQRAGKGRGVFYEMRVHPLLRPFDLVRYFQQNPDQREIQPTRFDFTTIKPWQTLFSPHELSDIDRLTRDYQKRLKTYRGSSIKKELERITIEFSWKSSQIEGNTYSLLDTERLIKERQEAPGKSHEEAIMILNHKTALEFVWHHGKDYRKLSLRKIEDIHSLIVHDLSIAKGLRKRPVGIVGTRYRPHDTIYQIREAVEALCILVNSLSHPFLKALVTVAGLSYIQPFEDGNKRTSRLMANALLVAYGYCPLSYRSVDEVEYKKAVIVFYEQHSVQAFKALLVNQYREAAKNYFL